MTSAYEEVELLDEVVEKPKNSIRRGRLAWVAMGVVALVALAGFNFPRQRRSNLKNNLRVARKALLAAFSARSLEEAKKFTSSIELTVAADGAEVPSAMDITFHIVKDEEPLDHLEYDFAFKPVEGKEDKLKEKFQKMWDTLCDGDDDMNAMLSINVEDGHVVLRFVPPPEDGDEISKDLGDEIPQLTANFKFGTTLTELYANADHDGDDAQEGILPMLVEGMSIKLQAGITVPAVEAIKTVEGEMGMTPGPMLDFMTMFSKLALSTEVRYRDAKEFKGALLEDLPEEYRNIKFYKGMIKDHFSHAPDEVKESMTGLEEYCEGLVSAGFRGLPHDQMLAVEMKGVQLTPILTDLVSE